jgi:hypothetical protein
MVTDASNDHSIFTFSGKGPKINSCSVKHRILRSGQKPKRLLQNLCWQKGLLYTGLFHRKRFHLGSLPDRRALAQAGFMSPKRATYYSHGMGYSFYHPSYHSRAGPSTARFPDQPEEGSWTCNVGGRPGPKQSGLALQPHYSVTSQ